jgi:RHS repeat-associated protein
MIGWGDASPPTAGQLVANGPNAFWVTGTHTYTDESSPGPYPLTVRVQYTANPALSPLPAQGSATVSDAPLSPLPLTLTAWPGVNTGLVTAGQFSDSFAGASATDFAATINWGDGSSAAPALVRAGSGGTFNVLGSHPYAANGSYPVTIVVNDDGGQTTTIASTATVVAPSAGLTAVEAAPFNGVVATFNSDPTKTVSASITWGDGSSSPGTITPTGPNSFTVSGSHTYADEVTAPLLVTVNLTSGGPLTASGPAVVSDAALTGTAVNVSGTAGKPLTAPPGQVTVATFTDAKGQATTTDFRATIAWGDGQTSAGLVQPIGNGFQVVGNHVYANGGIFTVTTTISDDGGAVATPGGTASIAVPEGQTANVVLTAAAPHAPGAAAQPGTAYTATVSWGDGTSSSNLPVTVAYQNGILQATVAASHVFVEEGAYPVAATFSDPAADLSMAAATMPVSDAPLAGAGQAISGVAGASTGTVTVATFTDANPSAANQEIIPGNPGATFSATINWGDNSTPTSGTIVVNSDGSFAVQGSHSYATAGSYSVQTTISDDGGQGTTATAMAQIAAPWTITGSTGLGNSNDPDRGFLLPLGEANIDLNQGAVRLSQALDFDQSPGTSVGGDPALVYNGASAGVRPVINLQVQSAASGTMPTSAQVSWTWNGVAQTPVSFNPSGLPAGSVYQMAVQVPTAQLSPGAYPWTATVTLTFPNNSTQQATTSGTAYIAAEDGSLWGAAWGIDGIPQLAIGPAGILWVNGSGDSRFFASNGQGGYTSPAEDFGTLAATGSTYTYTAKDKTKWIFNSSGQLTSVVDTHNLTLRSYSYDGQNRLAQSTAIDNGVTTIAYDPTSGLVHTITEPGGRVVTLGHDSHGNLTSIIDENGNSRTLGYDSNHHVTSDSWAPFNASFTYNATTGLLTQVNEGLGSTYTIVSAAAAGLGTIGSGPAWAKVTDALSHTTKYLLDSRGRLLQQVLADGTSTTSYQRNSAGDVTVMVDPLHHPTSYSYNASGDLVQVTYADGAFDAYTYDPTFHHVLTTSNALGTTQTNTYDGSNGDLLTSADGLGNTTTYVWSNGLLMTVTDPRGAVSSNSYDADRRLMTSVDNLGVPTMYTYDTNGNAATTTDALGRVTQTVYSGRTQLLQTIDANLGVTTQTFDVYGDLTSTTNTRGFTSTTTYDQRGWVTATSDFMGNTTQNQYDVAGNVTKTTDPRGFATTMAYDVDNRQTSRTDALGNVSTTAYDAGGNVIKTTDELGRITLYSYDSRNRHVSNTDPLGFQQGTFFDLAGNVVRTMDGAGSSRNTAYDADNRPIAEIDGRGDVSQTVYDPNGNIIQTIDGQGNPIFYTYDVDNRQIGTLDADHFRTSETYNVVGDLLSRTDERGKVTSYLYDLLDRQVSDTDPDGNTNQTLLDTEGNVIQTIDGNGKKATSVFDGDNRETGHTDEVGMVSSSTFDADGNEIARTDSSGTTLNFVDALDRVFASLDGDNHLTETVYNVASDVVASIDGLGHALMTAYNGDDQATGSRDADGNLTRQTYDGDGLVLTETDPAGNTTSYQYDGEGNTVTTTDALGHSTVQVYDKDNRLVSQTDRDGRQTTYTYDPDGRLLTETRSGGLVADTLQYTYDATGNLLTASNNYGTYTYTYDNAGQVLTQTDPFNLTLTYGYDHNGNVTSVQDSLGGQLTSVLDGDGRVTSRQFSGTGQTPLRIDLTYNNLDQIATITRYSDLGGTQKVGSSTYGYDGVGNVTSIVHSNGSGGTLASYSYTYDAANRLSSENDNGTVTNYSYDAANQLTAAGPTNYSYDANGNRTMAGYTTTADNRMTSDGTWNYQYDNEGNVILKTKISNGETWSYGYDNVNHLVSAIHKDGQGNLITQVTEKYDVFGNRLEEDVYTQATGQTVVSRFAFDGNNVWADLDGNNQLLMRRLYLDGDNQPFARITAAGVATWYLADHLGSIRDLQDNLSGFLVDHLDYDAYGNVTNETQPGNGDRFRFDGGPLVASVEMYIFDARWYDPVTGRWYSQDPMGLTPDSNPYRDEGNGPTNATDPSGLAKMDLPYPFKKGSKHIIFETSAEISNDGKTLTIKVTRGANYINHNKGFAFFPAMDGSQNRFNDTDSAQVAVRWTDGNDKAVGYATNAKPADKRRGGKPGAGADWTRMTSKQSKWVEWQTPVPEGATHLEVLMVYTDILFDTPARASRVLPYGDLPAIVASFSATKAHGKWSIKPNPNDLIQQQDGEPKLPQFEERLLKIRAKLGKKTGFALHSRPGDLEGILGPTKELDSRAIAKIIREAARKKLINGYYDTGFDLVPKK